MTVLANGLVAGLVKVKTTLPAPLPGVPATQVTSLVTVGVPPQLVGLVIVAVVRESPPAAPLPQLAMALALIVMLLAPVGQVNVPENW